MWSQSPAPKCASQGAGDGNSPLSIGKNCKNQTFWQENVWLKVINEKMIEKINSVNRTN